MAGSKLGFYCPAYVVKAEKSWNFIVAPLQSTSDCNVEIRINLMGSNSETKSPEVDKLSFGLFSCSRRLQRQSQSTTELGSDPSYNSVSLSEKPMIKINEKSTATCSSDSGPQRSRICCHTRETIKTLQDSDANAHLKSPFVDLIC